jgi:hypothetical protein
MRSALLLVLTLTVHTPAFAGASEDLQAARLNWKRANLQSYAFEFRTDRNAYTRRCTAIRVHVVRNKITRLVGLEENPWCTKGYSLPIKKYQDAQSGLGRTIDDHFSRIEASLNDTKCEESEVTYHSELGYPTSIHFIDKCITDHTSEMRISNLQPRR